MSAPLPLPRTRARYHRLDSSLFFFFAHFFHFVTFNEATFASQPFGTCPSPHFCEVDFFFLFFFWNLPCFKKRSAKTGGKRQRIVRYFFIYLKSTDDGTAAFCEDSGGGGGFFPRVRHQTMTSSLPAHHQTRGIKLKKIPDI